MKKTLFFAAVAATLMLGACSNDEEVAPVAKNTLTASIEEGTQTRTALDGLNVTWSAGDAFKVYNESGTELSTFTLKSGEEGKKVASFEGGDLTDAAYAAFPQKDITFPADDAVSGHTLKLNDGDLENLDLLAMKGTFNGEKVQFTHACGVLRVNFPIQIQQITFRFDGLVIPEGITIGSGVTYSTTLAKGFQVSNIPNKNSIDVVLPPFTGNVNFIGYTNSSGKYNYKTLYKSIKVEAGKVTTVNISL